MKFETEQTLFKHYSQFEMNLLNVNRENKQIHHMDAFQLLIYWFHHYVKSDHHMKFHRLNLVAFSIN